MEQADGPGVKRNLPVALLLPFLRREVAVHGSINAVCVRWEFTAGEVKSLQQVMKGTRDELCCHIVDRICTKLGYTACEVYGIGDYLKLMGG